MRPQAFQILYAYSQRTIKSTIQYTHVVVHAREIMRWSERSVERMLRVVFTLLLPALTAAHSGKKAHTHCSEVRGGGALAKEMLVLKGLNCYRLCSYTFLNTDVVHTHAHTSLDVLFHPDQITE